jgi:hypothetical protein
MGRPSRPPSRPSTGRTTIVERGHRNKRRMTAQHRRRLVADVPRPMSRKRDWPRRRRMLGGTERTGAAVVQWSGDRKQSGRGGNATARTASVFPGGRLLDGRSPKRRFGGSDGDQFRGCILPGYAVLWQAPPARRLSGRSRRVSPHGAQPRRLTPEQEAKILARCQLHSLRELALEYGVSHQTIRSAILRAQSRLGG